MDNQRRLDAAQKQLTHVLSFFPRLDAKHSVVLAIDTAMLAYMATRAPALPALESWVAIAPAVTIVLIAISIVFLYRGGAPALDGGQQSLIYFREIAKRREAQYIDAYLATTEAELIKDILGQVWRNSDILAKKFDHLQTALLFLALSIFPWLVSLATFAMVAPKP